jgi:GntR family transcriptional regulator
VHVPRELKYLEVKDYIYEAIRALPPGSLVPAERDLAATCQTSRTTVRKAVAELVAEGRVTRRQGAGTYVAEPKVAWPLTVSGLSAQAATGSSKIRSTLLSTERHQAGAELAERLSIRLGGQVLSMELLRTVNDTPIAIERTSVPGRRYPGLAATVARTGSVYEALRRKFGISVTQAVGMIETAPASPHEAALLQTEAGAPMLLVSRHGHTADGQPVEWVKTCYRGDRASFIAHLTQTQDSVTERLRQSEAESRAQPGVRSR